MKNRRNKNITTVITMVLAITLPVTGYSIGFGFTGDSRGRESISNSGSVNEAFIIRLSDDLATQCGGEQDYWRKIVKDIVDANLLVRTGAGLATIVVIALIPGLNTTAFFVTSLGFVIIETIGVIKMVYVIDDFKNDASFDKSACFNKVWASQKRYEFLPKKYRNSFNEENEKTTQLGISTKRPSRQNRAR